MDNKMLASVFSEMEERLNKLPGLSVKELDFSRTVVISIDINNGFAKGGALYSERIENLIPKTKELARLCKDNGIVIVALSDRHNAQSLELKSFPPHCMETTNEYLLVDEIVNLVPIIIEKNSTNAFFKFNQRELIQTYDNFIITGCCTDICIYQLAVTLRSYFNEMNIDKNIIVPMSLVDTYDGPCHNRDVMNNMFLNSMLDNGVQVVSNLMF